MQELQRAPAAATPRTFAKTFNTTSERMRDTQDACAALPLGLCLGYRTMLVLYDVLWMDNIIGGARWL
jgi:hypothetical protein